MNEQSQRPWVFDADGHVVEPDWVWERHLAPEHRGLAPRLVADPDGGHRLVVGGRTGHRIDFSSGFMAAAGQGPGSVDTPEGLRGGWDPQARLQDMDVEGIDVAALFPTYGLAISGHDAEAEVALMRAVNDWLADYCSADGRRLIGVGALPASSPRAALDEARRCVDDLGLRAVWRRPEAYGEVPPLHDPGHDALWEYLASAHVPFCTHSGYNGVVPQPYFSDRFDTFIAGHAAAFPVEQMMALNSLVLHGVLERHPALKVGLFEAGAAWVPWYLHRLDEHVETWPVPAQLDSMPSEYFRRQCTVTVEDLEPGLDAMLVDYPHNVLFASDYPHPDATFPGATRSLAEATSLSAQQREAVLRGNAEDFFGHRA